MDGPEYKRTIQNDDAAGRADVRCRRHRAHGVCGCTSERTPVRRLCLWRLTCFPPTETRRRPDEIEQKKGGRKKGALWKVISYAMIFLYPVRPDSARDVDYAECWYYNTPAVSLQGTREFPGWNPVRFRIRPGSAKRRSFTENADCAILTGQLLIDGFRR